MQSTALPIAEDTSEQESYLIRIWADLLGTPVSPEDNFFDLGGNSMLAVQMAERVLRERGTRLPLMRVAVQTLGEMASDLAPTGSLPAEPQGQGNGFSRLVKGIFGGRDSKGG